MSSKLLILVGFLAFLMICNAKSIGMFKNLNAEIEGEDMFKVPKERRVQNNDIRVMHLNIRRIPTPQVAVQPNQEPFIDENMEDPFEMPRQE